MPQVVRAVDDILDVMTVGDCYRTFAATNLNARSSRSHAIFTLNLNQVDGDECGKLVLVV